MSNSLVSVIIPVYNAERTIAAAIDSVLQQTYRQIEIVVVDDGSTDNSAEIIRTLSVSDDRITLVRQQNSGVAAARNNAIDRSAGSLIAPIDADDLWRPTKLSEQVAALDRAGASCSLVYSWSAHIDVNNVIVGRTRISHKVGDEINALCRYNIVGNGSAPLIRRDALIAVGGYDTGMQAAGVQGCEDYKLYLDLAESGEFRVVEKYLTGYRRHEGSMSTHIERMLASRRLTFASLLTRRPELYEAVVQGESEWLFYHFGRLVGSGYIKRANSLLKLLVASPQPCLKAAIVLSVRAARYCYLKETDLIYGETYLAALPPSVKPLPLTPDHGNRLGEPICASLLADTR